VQQRFIMQNVHSQAAIIGGGIMGAATALALRRFGVSVTLIERDLCGSRSSGVNYGGVRRQGRGPLQLPLAQRAHRIWGDVRALIGTDGEYVRSGHLKLARTEADMAALCEYRDRTRDFDLGLELLSRRELQRRWPWLGGSVVGGSLCPEDGHANPRLIAPAFARAARNAGTQIFENTRVEAVVHGPGGFELSCSPGLRVRSEVLVNCAGAWAGSIAAQFGEPVPMVHGHPVMAVTEPLPLFMDLSLGMEGGGIYGRQVSRGNCVIGGTKGYAIDDERARPSDDAILSVMRQALALLPALQHAHVIRCWTGTEGYLPDKQPVIGTSATTPGLFHAFGFAGAGFQIGPAVGAALAETIFSGQSSTSLGAFSVARFQTRAAAVAADTVHP
jgi:sarcosine oxidase subunit beta